MKGRFSNQKLFDIDALNKNLNSLESDLNAYVDEKSLASKKEKENTVREELRNGIQMVRLGAEIRNYGQQKEYWTSDKRKGSLFTMSKRLTSIQKEHRKLWLLRNKSGGLERSMEPFKKLDTQIKELIKVEQGNGFRRDIKRFKEKIFAGGANWYLKD